MSLPGFNETLIDLHVIMNSFQRCYLENLALLRAAVHDTELSLFPFQSAGRSSKGNLLFNKWAEHVETMTLEKKMPVF